MPRFSGRQRITPLIDGSATILSQTGMDVGNDRGSARQFRQARRGPPRRHVPATASASVWPTPTEQDPCKSLLAHAAPYEPDTAARAHKPAYEAATRPPQDHPYSGPCAAAPRTRLQHRSYPCRTPFICSPDNACRARKSSRRKQAGQYPWVASGRYRAGCHVPTPPLRSPGTQIR